ncbi:nitrate/nitrite transporter [Nakamurella multipartita]|uniref:Major facilitator superfamily MFS_1 n=1 Tax=Nakamurella multipartita (strain ATCC 700099 / DSM 44233 / CIP 104796 / JCM 9543 / NBRC 105858 / Y-104) TaxID=479431 RepID=C8XAE5_NAKMY|nr:nitrate/nitrite transporter [Nakamurella multipartita]ACV77310.1 major facilitator superfamily MFS_1 [Nakamurella multipartita DSM 44233]
MTGQGRNLALATWTFAINFWAWNLIGPLSTPYATAMSLSSTQTALLVATPILVGSVGRIPVGALTDRYGGRTMFMVVSVVSIAPVLLVAFAGAIDSYVLLLIFGFFLGIAGTAFAVGIPFVNAWYPPARRGFATGVFGIGMGGTALSAFFTPRFVNWFGLFATHVIIAIALGGTAVLVMVAMKDAPNWRPNTSPVLPKLKAAAKLSITWQMSLLYAVCFGGFVAFSTYLPTYLKTVYDFSITDAGARTAGFALAAVIARPIGGILSDRIGPKVIVLISLIGSGALAAVEILQPPAELPAGASFVALAFFLGIGTGGVFAWVARSAPPEKVGTVTGIVGAAGGLGGYFPPLVMGATYDSADNDYTVGLSLLVLTCALTAIYTAWRLHVRSSATLEGTR